MENLIIRDIQYQDYNDYFNLMIESSKSEFILFLIVLFINFISDLVKILINK